MVMMVVKTWLSLPDFSIQKFCAAHLLIPPSPPSSKSLARSYAACQETVVTSPLMSGFTEFIIIFGCSPLPDSGHTFMGAFASNPRNDFFFFSRSIDFSNQLHRITVITGDTWQAGRQAIT